MDSGQTASCPQESAFPERIPSLPHRLPSPILYLVDHAAQGTSIWYGMRRRSVSLTQTLGAGTFHRRNWPSARRFQECHRREGASAWFWNARPSPIRRGASAAQPSDRLPNHARKAGPTLPPLASASVVSNSAAAVQRQAAAAFCAPRQSVAGGAHIAGVAAPLRTRPPTRFRAMPSAQPRSGAPLRPAAGPSASPAPSRSGFVMMCRCPASHTATSTRSWPT